MTQGTPRPDAHDDMCDRNDYEPPRLERLGTLHQLTQGNAGHESDGIFTGSILA